MPVEVPPSGLDQEDFGAARELRAKGRRWVIGLGANLVLLGALLGGPYIRGHVRTRALWPKFGEAAACVLGGKPAPDPGLGLPHGADEAFAARVLSEEEGWPMRCEEVLKSLKQPQVTFLLPGVKTAELDIDVTVDLVLRELAALAQRPEGTRVPDRPLRALETLRAALARHAQAAGVLRIPQGDAIVLEPTDELPAAARVPLYAAADAEIAWSGTRAALTVLALDRRGLSFVRVRGGGLVERRASRPGRLRLLAGDPASGVTLLWAMRPTTCAERDDHCATKSVGVAALPVPFEGLPEPRWLAAHPLGRGDRSVLREGRRVRVLAASREGGAVVREFQLPEGAPPQPKAPPLAQVTEWPALEGASGGLLLPGEGTLAHGIDGDEAEFWLQRAGEPPRSLGRVPGGEAWSLACDSGRAGAFGTHSHLHLWRVPEAPGAEPWVSPRVHVPLEASVHAEHPSLDRVHVVCTGQGEPVWLGRAEGDLLTLVRCGRDDGAGCDKALVQSHVQFFDAVLTGENLVVAYAGSGARAQVRSRVIGLGDEVAVGKAQVPDPCWEGGGGLCGLPRLLVAGDRVLLGARERAEMRVMQSLDGGGHWTPMHGLRKAAVTAR